MMIYAALVPPAKSATFITATVTVTNRRSAGQCGDDRRERGPSRNPRTANPAIYMVKTDAAIGGATTNLFKQLAAYRVSGTSQVKMSGTNAVIFSGGADEAVTASVTAGWASLVLATNSSTATYAVRVPIQNTADGIAVVTQLTTDIDQKNTHAIAATSPGFVNFVNTSGNQTVGGNKTYSGALTLTNAANFFANGVISNGFMTNMQSLGVTNAFIANMQVAALTLSNTAPLLFFNETDAAANEKYTFLQSSTVGGVAGVRLVLWNDALSSASTVYSLTRSGITPLLWTINVPIQPTSIQNTTITNAALTNCNAGFTGGLLSGVYITNAAAIGGAISTLSGGVITGAGLTNATATNTTFTGNNTWTGDLRFTRANHTSLANGANAAVDFGTKVFVKIKAGPTGIFTIHGIANGADGKRYILYNATGQNMTIANDSGGDPTPANRIFTNTGADIVTTANGAVEVIYDSEDSRWVVTNLQL
jgi:hypothetical protein